jgi:hypothetical protein
MKRKHFPCDTGYQPVLTIIEIEGLGIMRAPSTG